MHFDDRLDTVLRQPVRGQAIARIQYVQLLDLLGKTQANTGSPLLDPAYDRLIALASMLPATSRAEILRGSGLKLRSPALIAFLADDEPAVASAAIATADLSEQQWIDLVPALPVAARGVLRHRRDLGPTVEARLARLGVADRGLPPAPEVVATAVSQAKPRSRPRPSPAPANQTPTDQTPASSRSEIGDLVRRIEAFRKAHPAPRPAPANDAPRLPLGDAELFAASEVRRFDFVTDPGGRIVRADADAAPMLIGLSLGLLPNPRVESAAPQVAQALRLRQPIEGQIVEITGAPAISGTWQLDGAPLFDAATGRYTGHAGRARRVPAEMLEHNDADSMADRMRQVLHELRNPAGAIQMASEFIQQQIGGTVSHEYRAIAASIASDTATVLAGLDELDRMVKHEAGVSALEPGESDLAANIAATVALLDPHMAQRESGFALDLPEDGLRVSIARGDLERLTWRLLAALAAATGAGERLALTGFANPLESRLEIDLPATLRDLSDEELFAAHARQRGPAISAGVFGLGFTLRLASAEARSAGGSLRREGSALNLILPRDEPASANIRGA
jgi:two-component system OmpR family sensor kinase